MPDQDTDSLAHQWYLYGKGQFDNGEYAGALDSFDEALRAPGTGDAQLPGLSFMKAVCLLRLHRVEEADALAAQAGSEYADQYAQQKQLASADSLGHRWYEYANAQIGEGNYQGAYDACLEALQAPGTLDEHKPGIHYLQAVALVWLHRVDEADAAAAQAGSEYASAYEDHKQRASADSPGHRMYEWAKQQYDTGNWQAAFDGFAETLQSPGTLPVHQAGIYLLQALCKLHLGDVAEADALADQSGPENRAEYDRKRAEIEL
jgi:tetratricopeptide (TPR) repeat protein